VKLGLIRSAIFSALTALGGGAALAQSYRAPTIVVPSAQRFRAPLAPYGRFAADQRYGEVFYPTTTYDPQNCGHWDEQSAWVSNQPYGSVTDHYGRWVQADAGWGWVADATYRVAPVEYARWDGHGRFERERFERERLERERSERERSRRERFERERAERMAREWREREHRREEWSRGHDRDHRHGGDRHPDHDNRRY
jgi:hypothetical protein